MQTGKYTTITKYEKDESDNIYFNIEIRSLNKALKDEPARYDVIRTIPIINDSSDYYACITRFNIPNFLVPLHIMPIQDNQPNINLSDYSVTLEYNGDVQHVYLIFVPRNTAQIPTPPSSNPGGKQISSPYYYIFDYQHMVNMVNTALDTAYNNLTAPPMNSAAPVMTFDPVNNLFTLVSQNDYYDYTLALPIKVYFNYPLWTIFGSFVDQQLIVENLTNDGRDVQILIKDYFYNNLNAPNFDPPFTGDYLALSQQYKTIFNWNPFKRIILTSNTLPINSEYVSGSGSSTMKIITDFIPLVDKNVRNVWQYNPQQYRLVDMISHQKIKKIDIDIYWIDQNDAFHQLLIPWQMECTLKLAFINKKLYKNYVDRKTVKEIRNRH